MQASSSEKSLEQNANFVVPFFLEKKVLNKTKAFRSARGFCVYSLRFWLPWIHDPVYTADTTSKLANKHEPAPSPFFI